jgi:hypothetical protein
MTRKESIAAAQAVNETRPAPLVSAHFCHGPKLLVDIRTVDGRVPEHVRKYIIGVLDILTSIAIEDSEKPALLSALSTFEPEPVSLSEGVPRV